MECQFLKSSWRRSIGLPESEPQKKIPTIEEIYETQWNDKFEELMRNRLAMGLFRYGPLWEQKGAYDNVGGAIKRLQKYIETGNTEHLVDAANLCLCEFTNGDHPLKHFESIDDGEHTQKKEITN